MTRKCENCIFFNCDVMNADNENSPPIEWWGECRVHAPLRLPVQGELEGKWPRVRTIDWCGDHQYESEEGARFRD